jgi:hypothetical protein
MKVRGKLAAVALAAFTSFSPMLAHSNAAETFSREPDQLGVIPASYNAAIGFGGGLYSGYGAQPYYAPYYRPYVYQPFAPYQYPAQPYSVFQLYANQPYAYGYVPPPYFYRGFEARLFVGPHGFNGHRGFARHDFDKRGFNGHGMNRGMHGHGGMHGGGMHGGGKR